LSYWPAPQARAEALLDPWENKLTPMDEELRGGVPLSDLPSGKLSHNYGKSPFLMGKSTINSHVQ